MTLPWEILVVSSDLENRRPLISILHQQGWDAVCASTIDEAMAVLTNETVGLVFCDQHLADGSYRDFLAASRYLRRTVRTVVTSADWDESSDAVRLGAFDVIASPCRPTDVEWMVIQAKRAERNRTQPPVPA